jgi:hypothetical protein
MAGSYNHVVKDDGNLASIKRITNMLENGGDVYEAVEEMYGMIWWMAGVFAAPAAPPSEVKRAVEAARQSYKEGLRIAKEVNTTT